jgi:hypothetical protein
MLPPLSCPRCDPHIPYAIEQRAVGMKTIPGTDSPVCPLRRYDPYNARCQILRDLAFLATAEFGLKYDLKIHEKSCYDFLVS